MKKSPTKIDLMFSALVSLGVSSKTVTSVTEMAESRSPSPLLMIPATSPSASLEELDPFGEYRPVLGGN